MNEQVVTTRPVDRFMLLVVAACAVTLPLSIMDAGWMPRSGTLLLVCLLGLASGALLGPLRLARTVRWPISLAAALALAMSNAGLFNVSVQASRLRMMTWGTDLLAGRTVNDSGFIMFWVALLVWWASYSAAHGITSGGRALDALLPTTVSLAINTIYAHPNISFVLLLIFGSIVLMAWTAQGQRQASWISHQLDYPEDWMGAMGSGLLIAAFAFALAWLFPVLTSKTTFEWLSNTFDSPVSEARQTFTRMLGGATPVASSRFVGSMASLPTSRLIGEPPELAGQVVMWVWTDEPAPPPGERPDLAAPVAKAGWRGLTYSMYTGRGWSNPELVSRPLTNTASPLSGKNEVTSTVVMQRFEIVAPHGDTVFAANQPMSGDAGLVGLYGSKTDADLIGLRGAPSHYTVTSRLILPDEDALRGASGVYTSSGGNLEIDVTPYLQLPDTLPQRVRDLAVRVTRDSATPFDKALSVETFLRTYTYTLDLPPFPEGRDLVDYFLFDAPGGYCDYYASAMVVMLRVVGVPARLASGYTRGTYDYGRGEYRVIGKDAHSWPEVYFTGIGWVEFEPTAAQPLLTRPSSASASLPVSDVGVSAGEVRAEQSQLRRMMVLTWSVIGVALLTAAVVIYLVRRERQLAALSAGEVIPLLYERLRKRGAWLGVDVRSSDTPDEFVTAFNRAIGQRAARRVRWRAHAETAQKAAARIGELYRQASYSPRQPGAGEARQAWNAWRALQLRMWLFVKFPVSNLKSQN